MVNGTSKDLFHHPIEQREFRSAIRTIALVKAIAIAGGGLPLAVAAWWMQHNPWWCDVWTMLAMGWISLICLFIIGLHLFLRFKGLPKMLETDEMERAVDDPRFAAKIERVAYVFVAAVAALSFMDRNQALIWVLAVGLSVSVALYLTFHLVRLGLETTEDA